MKRFSCTDPNFLAKFTSALADSSHDPEVEKVVRDIVDDVRRNGDSALIELTARFDGPLLSSEQLRVSPDEVAAAVAALDPLNREAIEESITNVGYFHKHCRPENWLINNPHGGQVGERYYPLRRVGLYVPGGQVPLVSTVIMIATLAKAAGVPEIAVSTPPQSDGSIAPELLAALSLCQIEEIYKVGGAQAIAAFAHGTETIGAVDKIFGPGNAYVNEAKRHVFGIVGIDLLPGPSEVMVIADETANPSYIAATLLAQAEHGSGKEHVFLASTSSLIIEQALVELDRQIKTLSHRSVIQKTLESGLYVIETENEKILVEVANLIAPEHLELQVKESKIESLTAAITTAGAIMQGHDTPTVLGDFAAGPSHVLPTGRASRFSSGLRLSDFFRRSSIIRYNRDALREADSIIKRFASMENLDGHRRSLSVRLTDPET